MGGTPKEILENEDIMELMVIPVMRADWAVLDRYQYVEDEPLDIPITVLRGNEDTVATEAQQMHWQLQTSNEFDYHVFSGDHFFLKPKEREVLKVVYDHIKNHIV
jgi:medium-chain acyl-[acyl-carrier-protein] hydrolase